ncbi:hypothetical protein OV079_36115 [Nannocystis pusilla]|uniref:Uncharacterized protein n=1 Tax=Nannocystis pusilla TaxID=889268 RepID=A0A9X3EWN6_9BACT|nr:hypothetical protein [Nannocystis pusilla]MCY1010899.1 hypothetical protein [Nannocystis pusilla]
MHERLRDREHEVPVSSLFDGAVEAQRVADAGEHEHERGPAAGHRRHLGPDLDHDALRRVDADEARPAADERAAGDPRRVPIAEARQRRPGQHAATALVEGVDLLHQDGGHRLAHDRLDLRDTQSMHRGEKWHSRRLTASGNPDKLF